MNDNDAMQLGNYIDKLTGTIAWEKTGIGTNTRAALSSLGLFAPRYYLSQAALMGDIVRGGVRGQQAWKALVGYQAGMYMAYIGLAEATKPFTG